MVGDRGIAMKNKPKSIGIIALLIIIIIAIAGIAFIRSTRSNSKPTVDKSEWTFRQNLWDRIDKKLEEVNVLTDKGDHLQGAFLLSEIAAVQSIFQDELGSDNGLKDRNEPTFIEAMARMQFSMAGKESVYEEMLKLKYPEWDPTRR